MTKKIQPLVIKSQKYTMRISMGKRSAYVTIKCPECERRIRGGAYVNVHGVHLDFHCKICGIVWSDYLNPWKLNDYFGEKSMKFLSPFINAQNWLRGAERKGVLQIWNHERIK